MNTTGRPSSESDAAFLRADSLELLDYPAVRQRLARLTTFFDARRLALDLAPSSEPDEVERLQAETSEARTLLDEIGDAALHTDSDISDALARAELEGVLTGAELAAVVATLAVHAEARAAVRKAGGRTPILAEMVSGIPDLEEVRRHIVSRIDPDGGGGRRRNADPPRRAQARQPGLRKGDGGAHQLDAGVGHAGGAPGPGDLDSWGEAGGAGKVGDAPPGAGHRPRRLEHGGDAVRRAVRHRGAVQRVARAGSGGGEGDRTDTERAVGIGGRRRGGDAARLGDLGAARPGPGERAASARRRGECAPSPDTGRGRPTMCVC